MTGTSPQAPPPYTTVVFDCDSTLCALEGIDELAAGAPDQTRRAIEELTNRAMGGDVPLEDVYAARLDQLRPSRAAIRTVGARYVETLLPRARELCSALRSEGKRVAIVSGGLRPAVLCAAEVLGVHTEDVYAVDLEHDSDGAYVDFERASPLARGGGKIEILRGLAADGPTAFVGDGVTDLEAAGEVARFIAFGGVVRRPAVFDVAEHSVAKPDFAALTPLLFDAPELERLATSAAFRSLF